MNKKAFREGFRDGIPIGLGYFAVSFSLGITARAAGLNWFQGFLASALTSASAGEYAGFMVIRNQGTFLEMALLILIANCRYLLMSTALSQRFSPKTKFYHRPLVGFYVTDELFGINIARPGYLEPTYAYAAILACVPAWAVGTAIGVIAGNILPDRIVSALGVALYGMFIAIIIPPARKDRIIAVIVAVSFVFSYLAGILPGISAISSEIRIIILTVGISVVAALLFPIKDEEVTHDEQNV